LRNPAIARNYAEALLALGESSRRMDEYADLLDALAAVIETSPEIRSTLMSPRVPKGTKAALLGQALQGAGPEFVRFIQAVVRRGRQGWIGDIAREYGYLVDAKHNRARATVMLARQPDAALQESLRKELSRAFGKEIIPTWVVDAGLLGGVIVKLGERVYDGSLRRGVARLRQQLLAGS
jgi:F-type H+-transporting ATPase subunit delta